MNFLTISVAFSFLSCILFTVVVIILLFYGIDVPDMLIQCFFTTFGLEFGATAAIKIAKYVTRKKEVADKIELLNENKLPIEKEDLKPSSDSDDSVYSSYDSYTSYDSETCSSDDCLG